MKKLIVLALSAVMSLSLVTCGDKANPAGNHTQMPNPFSEYSSLEEAAGNAGFPFDVPETVDGYSQRIIRAMAGGEGAAMIEVIYQNEIDENESTDRADEIRMRKAKGDEDISGDYTEYSETGSLTIGNIQATVKGEHGNIHLATWTDNGYTYSIGAYSETGITAEEMSDLIAVVK